MSKQKILVTGASGYIGARLIPYLLKKGYIIRAAGRSLDRLRSRPWANHPDVELCEMNIFNFDSVRRACMNCQAAYYLVHSMNSVQKSFADADRRAAQNMISAAESAQLNRIIYLGGLGDLGQETLSKHLESRAEVSDILHSSRVPTTTLRAAMVIGTASVSYEILTYLVRRLPIMITPKWVNTKCQPIAIRNVIHYLVGCLEHKQTVGQVFDIGGSEVITYHQLMRIYEKEAKLLKRLVIPVPILTPRLSSYWIHLVTPIPAYLARPLAEGLKNTVICQDDHIRDIIPQDLIDCRGAIRLSLDLERREAVKLDNINMEFPPIEQKFPGDPPWAGTSQPKKT